MRSGEKQSCGAMVSWRGIYFVLTLFLGSFFGSIFMLGPFLPLMFISPAWYRWITDSIVATWLTLPVALLEMVFGAKVVVTGDGFVPGERSVIIMNHRTRMDWMFLWNCLLRYSYLRLEKICLKSSLKSIPGFANTKARSNEFAEKNGLQKYEYVLHPRTTGFTFVVERLREGDNLDAIHDITVAYPQNIPQTEKHLLNGNFPKEIHFHVQRYPIETVPISKEALQLWCRKRWEEKEERLRHFYEGGKCFSTTGQSIIPPCKSELRVLAVKCISLLYWTVFPLGMLALLYLYSFAQWYFAAMIIFFVVQQKIFGGLELIELACHRYFKKQQKIHDMKVKTN
ncbi:lysocardiolipin acyltransferase 1 isoform X3 [Pezoporus wallicus]|uniref:lysocardiolipin acyltransferase 1 isoform X3 n=1 Tax=Pezoporus wallicus TaxID=35540 RepID=UPI00254FA3EB|nr:lysocardiolipin acyltransferase 1 isoform X3 [Pezoporus wallicus]XP_061331454.1 lysocardiolipin acyltransferase 1 isoform X3 [Pezoporus flaviventris]